MNKELWNEFLDGEKIAINCRTEKEAEEFLRMCDKEGFTWCGGGNLLSHVNWWNAYKERTYLGGEDKEIQYGTKLCFEADGYKTLSYSELMGETKKEDKKTFTGPELAQAILDEKFKEGTKFKSECGRIYTVKMFEERSLGLYYSYENVWATSLEIINRTFTLIEEPKLYYFNQVRNTGKKIKYKDWDNFYTLQKTLKMLSEGASELINEAFNKKVWEVEE